MSEGGGPEAGVGGADAPKVETDGGAPGIETVELRGALHPRPPEVDTSRDSLAFSFPVDGVTDVDVRPGL